MRYSEIEHEHRYGQWFPSPAVYVVVEEVLSRHSKFMESFLLCPSGSPSARWCKPGEEEESRGQTGDTALLSRVQKLGRHTRTGGAFCMVMPPAAPLRIGGNYNDAHGDLGSDCQDADQGRVRWHARKGLRDGKMAARLLVCEATGADCLSPTAGAAHSTASRKKN